MGYARAGFEVVGVDIKPQPRYPFEFCEADALQFLSDEEWGTLDSVFGPFDAIHASPPCQAHVKGLAAVNRAEGRVYDHPDLIEPTRELLKATGIPYVIENVVGAPLENTVRLCVSSFDLAVRRHRLFECSFPLLVPPCDHSREDGDFWTSWRPKGNTTKRAKIAQVYGAAGETHTWGPAMGIDWMTPQEMTQAIPPDYTEFIGVQLMVHLGHDPYALPEEQWQWAR